jgi:hypothetical protein
VKLLEAEPTSSPEVGPQAPHDTPPAEPSPAAPEAVPTCTSCGAPMEPEQDWCLTCGTAAPGRLGQRPGLRAASTIIALTLALVVGAVAAGYAAITSDGNKQQPQASAPPAGAHADVAPPATQTPAPTQSQPAPTTPGATTNTLPKVKTPKAPTAQGTPVTPVPPTTPGTTSLPSTSTPTPSTSIPSTPTPSTSTPSTSTPQQTTPTQPQGPQPIELAGTAGSAYDPYGRAKASGQTARALDGDASTSWYVDPADPQTIGVGYAVNLGKLTGIREVDVDTSTPGFKLEIYATDEPQLPPDILDTRWSHITNVPDVGTKDDGKQKIVLGAGTTKYRNLLLWFTSPPKPATAGGRLRLVDLKVLGG